MPRRTVRVAVGGVTLRVDHERPVAALDPPPYYGPFLARRGSDIHLTLRLEPAPQPAPERLLFDSGGPWRVYRHQRGFLYTFSAPGASPPTYKAVWVDVPHVRGSLYLPRQRGRRQPRFAPAYPMDELLFQHRLAREGAVVLHAAGLVRRGGAVLLGGASGAGKSTLARLWRRHRPRDVVLSDDRIVVAATRGEWRSHGTPWHGEAHLAAAEAHPTAAIFFLRQGATSVARRLDQTTTTALLVARSFPPIWNRTSVRRALHSCDRLARKVPGFELTFRPDASALDAIEAALEVL